MKYGFLIHLTYQVIKKYNIEDFFSVDDLYPKVVEELENFPLLNKYSNKGKNEIPLTLKTKSKYGNWINLHVSTKKQFWFIKQKDTFKFDNKLIPLLDEDIQNLLANFDNKLNQLFLSNHLQECLDVLFELLSLQQCFFGFRCIQVSDSYTNIGFVYDHLGEHTKSILFHKKSLKIKDNILGEGHLNTAMSYTYIANKYSDLGDYTEALKFNKKALEIREHILGKEHVNTATSYNNIAVIYSNLGDYTEALKLNKKALEIYESILGNEHVDTATSYNNIALTYSKLGNYTEALKFNKKALEIRESVLGKEHVDTATSYNNIAVIYRDLGDYTEALKLNKKALEIYESILGNEHVDTAISYENIALTYIKLGNYTEALKFNKKALEIREHILGKEHVDTATSYNNIALTYSKLGNCTEALKFNKKAVEIRESVLGKEHVDTVMSYTNIASNYSDLGDYTEALKLNKKALEIYESILGNEHVDTATSYNNIALTYSKLGDYTEALKFNKKALEIREHILGKEHVDTATSYNNIAVTYIKLGDYTEALKFNKKALKIKEIVLGKEHVDTATSYNNIALTYINLKNYKESYQALKKSLTIKKDLLNKISKSFDKSLTTSFSKTQDRDSSMLTFFEVSNHYLKELDKYEKVTIVKETYNIWLNHKGNTQDNEALLSVLSSSTDDKSVLKQIELLKSKKYYLAKLLQEQTSQETRPLIESVKSEISELEIYLAEHINKFKEEQELSKLLSNEISNYLSSNSVFIDFAYGKKNIYIFIIHNNETIDFIEISSEDTTSINENILNFRNNIDETIAKMNNKNIPITKEVVINKKLEVQDILNKLYSVIMGKYLNKYIDNYQKLIISQDGLLNQLPFESLYDGEEYLLHKKNITYIASGKEFIRLNRFGSYTDENMDITVFANPDYGYNGISSEEKNNKNLNDFRTMRALDAFGKCDPLPKTQDEAKAIKDVYQESHLYTEINADENNLKTLKNSKILHIATHGMVVENKDEKEPLLKCALALTSYNTSIDKKEDYGIFTGLKIAALDLKATDLVVLSACESAKGVYDDVYGVSSLSRAFMMAGVNATIASLWEANDVMAQQFFTKYYLKLQEQSDYAKTFKETQLEIFKEYKQEDLEHPLFWACFCFFGLN